MIFPWDTVAYTAEFTADTNLCPHHSAHTAECGYSEPVAESPCGHIHDGNCGYREATAEIPCGHVHDANCGYQEASAEIPCAHQHDENCGWQEGVEGSCMHTHDEICGYRPAREAVPCIHTHDENCGYQAAADAVPCMHTHDETCGYREASAGSPCTYKCQICNSENDSENNPENDPEDDPVYLLADQQSFTVYDNGTEDGVDAEVRFTAKLPAGTGFFVENGAEVNLSETNLILKARQYKDNEEDNALTSYSKNKDMLNAHMKQHTETEDAVSDVQFWRLWFEDGNGNRVTAALPANGRAEVVTEYLPGKEETYPKALRGELGNVCTGVMDMGALEEGIKDQDSFCTTEKYSMQVSDDPADMGKTDGYYTKITYYIDADENGDSPWGNLTALYTLEAPEVQAGDMGLTYTANGTENDETVDTKFTVTLPEGTAFRNKADETPVEENAVLTLHAVRYTNTWTGFVSHRDLIDQHMNWHTGVENSTNDAQFWRIYLTDENGGEVDVRLPEGTRATVVVEYPDSAEALKGELGTRRTCVMDMGDPEIAVPDDFVNTDDYALTASNVPGDLIKNDTCYEKLTYYIDAGVDGNSAWGNLTALCAMKLTPAYMEAVTFREVSDGTKPFDAEEPDGDQPGNDSSAQNGIVRTFDNVNYTLQLVAGYRASVGTMDEYVAVMEADLARDISEARFDSGSLTNVFYGDEDWRIEYKDTNRKNLYIENRFGIYKCDGNGVMTQEKVSLNAIISGSNNQEGRAYRTDVASQHLVAYRKITSSNEQTAVPSTQTVTVQINVLAAQNGTEIAPKFDVYVKGNKDNFTSEQDALNNYIISEPSDGNKLNTADETVNKVTRVSAAARYNMVLKRNVDSSYSSYFDFSSGKESSADQGGTYGRMLTYVFRRFYCHDRYLQYYPGSWKCLRRRNYVGYGIRYHRLWRMEDRIQDRRSDQQRLQLRLQNRKRRGFGTSGIDSAVGRICGRSSGTD